jgi:hypothetical protein
MNAVSTVIATIEADHTVKVPNELPVGEQVMIIRVPSITTLLKDPERRARFAATRMALLNAMQHATSTSTLSDDEIVTLVKRARKATKGA